MCLAATPVVMAQISTAATIAATAYSVYSAQKMASFQKDMANRNARIAEMQAADAIQRGEAEADQYGQQVDQLISQQKAALAANGILIDQADTSGKVLLDTREVGERDMLQIRNNAARQAWGFRVNAQDSRLQGQVAMLEGRNKQISSLLSGADAVASKWYKFSKQNPNWYKG